MVLTLTRGGSTMRVPLRLPASPAEELEAFERLDTISSNFRTTRVADPLYAAPRLPFGVRAFLCSAAGEG